MNYLVSIEDTTYHHWQTELLIESFKLLNLQNSLTIAVATNNLPKNPLFTSNLKNHPHIFQHENIGQQKNNLPLNRAYATYVATTKQLISQPFSLIDPDMLLHHPIPTPNEHITFSLNHLLTEELATSKCNTKNFGKWIPLGNVITFNNVPQEFFARTLQWLEILNSNWWLTEKTAWIMTLLEYNGYLKYKDQPYEMTLRDKIHSPLIHYQHGYPPKFNKKLYTFKENVNLGNLFDDITQLNDTNATSYLKIITNLYLKRIHTI